MRTYSMHFCELLDRNIRISRIRGIGKFINDTFRKGKPVTIVGIGLSGAIIGCSISQEMNCNLCLVRKERSVHTSLVYEAESDFEEYVIVDDQIATGATIRTIRDSLTKKKCIGIVLYNISSPEGYFNLGQITDIPIYAFTRAMEVRKFNV